MSIFGWSYPPGAANDPNAPYNQEGPCEVCCRFVDDCICPECKTCGEIGNPECYECYDGVKHHRNKREGEFVPSHGMVRTPAQIASHAEITVRWEADAKAQAEAEAKWFEEAKELEGYEV